MTAVAFRENTFKIDLKVFEKRPSFEDVHKFIFRTIGLRPQEVQRLQMNHAQHCVHVKCRDFHTALSAVEQHNNRHELEVSGKRYKVQLLMADERVEVKVHDLSENVTDAEISSYLEQYGEVFNIKEAVWGKNYDGKGIPSGIRVVQMKLKKHIKSYVTISSEQTYISYKSQPASCRHCTLLLHTGRSCTENKKLLAQTTSSNAETSVKSNSKNEAGNILIQQQKLQQQPHCKRAANQIDTTAEDRSPPSKRKDDKIVNIAEPEIVQTEFSTDDDDDVDDNGNAMETNDTDEEEPDPRDSEQWINWLLKQRKKKNRKHVLNCKSWNK